MATSTNNDDSHLLGFDTASVASSTLTGWSAAIRTKFPWLRGGRTSTNGNHSVADFSMTFSVNGSSQYALFYDKQRELSACLNGISNDEEVDLWKLREMALSRGGFVSSTIRKRAWPKLMGAHEHVLLHYASSRKKKQVREVSVRELQQINFDLEQRMEWHVVNHVTSAREEQYQQDELERQQQEEEASTTKKVSFASPPCLVVSSPDSQKQNPTSNSPPLDSITTISPTNGTVEEKQDNEEERDDEDNDPAISPMSGGALTPSLLNSPASSILASTLSHKKTVTLSRHEQDILRNLLVSVLRNLQEESCYFGGLHNLAAVLLINLESPSLTCLILGKLSGFHLRDAMTKPTMSRNCFELGRAVQVVLPLLLQELDPTLHEHVVVRSKISSFQFVLEWTKSWFAESVVEHIRVASRLVDVFLVSHASMPLYISLAIMTHPLVRNAILDTPCTLRSMHMVLKTCILRLFQEENEVMTVWEDVIETAVSYTRQLSPVQLKELVIKSSMANNKKTSTKPFDDKMPIVVSSIAMLNEPPSWAVSCRAPTDWALLQQAKQMRSNKQRQVSLEQDKEGGFLDPVQKEETTPSYKEIQEAYPNAVAATGLVVPLANKRHVSRKVIVRIMIALGVVLLMTGSFLAMRGRALPEPLESTKAVDDTLIQPSRVQRRQRKNVVAKPVPNDKPEKTKKPAAIVKPKPAPLEKKTTTNPGPNVVQKVFKSNERHVKPNDSHGREVSATTTKPIEKKRNAVAKPPAQGGNKTVSRNESKETTKNETAQVPTKTQDVKQNQTPMPPPMKKNTSSSTPKETPVSTNSARRGFQRLKSLLHKRDSQKAVKEPKQQTSLFGKLASIVKRQVKLEKPAEEKKNYLGKFFFVKEG